MYIIKCIIIICKEESDYECKINEHLLSYI